MNWLHFFASFVKLAVVGHGRVGVEMRIPDESCFRNEENDEWEHRSTKYGDKIERPLPSDGARHLSNDHRREEGTTEQAQVAQGHSLASLMHEI